jgi:predicted transcriptional regulator
MLLVKTFEKLDRLTKIVGWMREDESLAAEVARIVDEMRAEGSGSAAAPILAEAAAPAPARRVVQAPLFQSRKVRGIKARCLRYLHTGSATRAALNAVLKNLNARQVGRCVWTLIDEGFATENAEGTITLTEKGRREAAWYLAHDGMMIKRASIHGEPVSVNGSAAASSPAVL